MFAVLSVYWRENSGQATVEQNAKIKLKLLSYFLVFPQVRTKSYLHSKRKGFSSRVCQQDGCSLHRERSVSASTLTLPTCCLQTKMKKKLCGEGKFNNAALALALASHCPDHDKQFRKMDD